MSMRPDAPPGVRTSQQVQATLTGAVGHYENFPVASWLCPPALRPAVVAIYHFARTADDLADEGDAPAAWRLDQLSAMRAELRAAAAGTTAGGRWPAVFNPLATTITTHRLPVDLLDDLLCAFEQDVRHTEARHRYASQAELLDYCRLSANPVGRLLLHLYGIDDEVSLRQSDAVCTALQLINFWQDISRDHARERHYLPGDVLARHGVRLEDFSPLVADEAVRQRCAAAVAELCTDARSLMNTGAPLATRVPGRAGWELRLVVQGGLRILDHCASLDFRTWLTRPRLRATDLPLMLWRAGSMPSSPLV